MTEYRTAMLGLRGVAFGVKLCPNLRDQACAIFEATKSKASSAMVNLSFPKIMIPLVSAKRESSAQAQRPTSR